jgi:hypothetical protein
MNPLVRKWKGRALGLAALVTLSGCTVAGEGYVGAVYEPAGYEYDSWQTGYYVAPPRGGRRVERHDERGDEHRGEGGGVGHVAPVRAPNPPPVRAYRPAPPTQSAPSIPTRPSPRGHDKTPPGHEKNRH